MARYNIESSWDVDPRRKLLSKKLGGDRLADGMLVEIISLVFSHSKNGGLIPYSIFKHVENAQDWIDCDLAVLKDEVVYVRGSSKYSEFFEKQKANGKRGGRPKQTHGEINKPKITQNNPDEPKHKPEKPSISISSSISNKETTTTTELKHSDILEAWGDWNETLSVFGVKTKNLSPPDERTLVQAIKSLGITRVKNALIGKRFETKSSSYDPVKTLSLEYCLSRNAKTGNSNHERLENLALAGDDTELVEAERIARHIAEHGSHA